MKTPAAKWIVPKNVLCFINSRMKKDLYGIQMQEICHVEPSARAGADILISFLLNVAAGLVGGGGGVI